MCSDNQVQKMDEALDCGSCKIPGNPSAPRLLIVMMSHLAAISPLLHFYSTVLLIYSTWLTALAATLYSEQR
jgi:hypothetical protein